MTLFCQCFYLFGFDPLPLENVIITFNFILFTNDTFYFSIIKRQNLLFLRTTNSKNIYIYKLYLTKKNNNYLF